MTDLGMSATYSAMFPSRVGADIFVPRPHQIQAGEAILAARKAGRPGFLLGDMTGLGKTLATWLALADMPETEILIVCPKGAVAQWRRTIHLSGSPPRDVTIINYERIKSLLIPPAAGVNRATRAKNNELANMATQDRVWPVLVCGVDH